MALRSSNGFLKRLAGDTSGNVLAMMAMAIFPLAGMVGGGVDMSRLYLAKSRLQQACDAGALAGRKVMGGGTWTADNNAAPNTADEFFVGNYKEGAYGTTGLTKAFRENAGKVTGTASVTVPMTVMRILGAPSKTLEVTCEAELRLPNTDIMFVLDTTGSMTQTLPGDSNTKIVALKKAVKCFYEAVARLNTTATCETTGTGPSGGTGTQTQIRFGFVAYSANVNVGRQLPPAYLADSWDYQSRVANFNTVKDVPTVGTPSAMSPYESYASSISQSDCVKYGRNESFGSFAPNPSGVVTTGGPAPAPTTAKTYSNNASDGVDWSWAGSSDTTGTARSCRRRFSTTTTTYERRYAFTNYSYRPEPIDVSLYKTAAPTAFVSTNLDANSTVKDFGTYDLRELAVLPNTQGITATNETWDGCIEERATIRKTSYTSLTTTERADAKDLNIDLLPSSSNAGSMWGPVLPGINYTRSSYNPVSNTTTNFNKTPYQGCPTQAEKLRTWTTPSDVTAFETYVDSLAPFGSTYHDIGLVWGARFISPTGIFAAENALTPGGGEIDRHIIFMTDGATCTLSNLYTAYGNALFDRRQTPIGTTPTADGDDTVAACQTPAPLILDDQVNARFEALCTSVKNLPRTTLWVVYFGTTDAATTARMTNCATPGNFQPATNSVALIDSFKSIADKISQLRLVQ